MGVSLKCCSRLEKPRGNLMPTKFEVCITYSSMFCEKPLRRDVLNYCWTDGRG